MNHRWQRHEVRPDGVRSIRSCELCGWRESVRLEPRRGLGRFAGRLGWCAVSWRVGRFRETFRRGRAPTCPGRPQG